MLEKYISINDRSIFYRVTGDGKPVMLIHGFGEDGEVWKDQIEALNKFKLIVPDLPGSGRSEMIDDMSIEGMAEVIKEIVDEESPSQTHSKGKGFAKTQNQLTEEEVLSEDNFINPGSSKVPPSGGFRGALIAHSMGGYIALAFAEKYPQYLNGLGLFHSTSYADTEEKKVARRKGIEFIKQHGGFEFLKTTTPNLFSPGSKNEMPALIDKFTRSLSNFREEALVSYYEAMMQRPDRSAVLKNAKIPILFIAGKYDSAVPLKDCLEQCHLPEITYFHVLQKSGHMGMMEESKKSNEVLEEYFNYLSLP